MEIRPACYNSAVAAVRLHSMHGQPTGQPRMGEYRQGLALAENWCSVLPGVWQLKRLLLACQHARQHAGESTGLLALVQSHQQSIATGGAPQEQSSCTRS